MERGEQIRKYWFMSQFQLKEGTHPTLLNKFGNGYRISDLRKYNSRYKHIKHRSSQQFYLSLGNLKTMFLYQKKTFPY